MKRKIKNEEIKVIERYKAGIITAEEMDRELKIWRDKIEYHKAIKAANQNRQLCKHLEK